MSDFIWSYKNFTNFLQDDHNNIDYGNFKHALYGSHDLAQNGQTCYGSYNCGANSRGNQDAQYHGGRRMDFQNLMNDIDEAYQDKESADRRTNYQGHNERKEYSHLDELERLSSCLVRLLGEARKEHGKLRQKLAFPTQNHTVRRPKRRIETSVNHALPENFAEVQSGAGISPESYSGENIKINAESPLSVGMCNTPSTISEIAETTKSSTNGGSWNTNLVTSNNLHSGHRGTVKPIFSPPSHGNHDSLLDKERKKKDSHNKVERRRRVHINKKIEELGSLLPSHEKTKFRPNKGSVLKDTVDYIKQLQKDQERLGKLEERQSQNHLSHKKILLRLQRLEAIMKIESESKSKGFPESSQELATVVQSNIVNNVTILSQVKSTGSQQVPLEAIVRENTASDKDEPLAALDFDDVIGDSSDDWLFSSPPGNHNSFTEEAVNYSE